MRLAKLYLAPVVLLLGSGGAFAQTGPPPPATAPATLENHRPPKEDKSRLRDLKGLVHDEAGTPIEGAVVQLKNLKDGSTVDFITKQGGTYLFYDLNMDIDYQLTAKRDGYNDAVTKKLTKYDSRRPAILNFEMERKKKSS